MEKQWRDSEKGVGGSNKNGGKLKGEGGGSIPTPKRKLRDAGWAFNVGEKEGSAIEGRQPLEEAECKRRRLWEEGEGRT